MLFKVLEPDPREPVCLAFANTVSYRGTDRERDRFGVYGDLKTWLKGKDLVEEGSSFGEDAKVVERARRLRESVYAIGSALASGRRVPSSELDELNWSVQRAAVAVRLVSREGELAWDVSPLRGSVTGALGLIALSAAQLFTSELASRVRECRNAECGWLFVDLSKNRSRKWCDMADCGNLEKARRYYAKQKALSG